MAEVRHVLPQRELSILTIIQGLPLLYIACIKICDQKRERITVGSFNISICKKVGLKSAKKRLYVVRIGRGRHLINESSNVRASLRENTI